MTIASPFDGLQITRDLVCEFFAVFSRFEFALKESGFICTNRGYAAPLWREFSATLAKSFQAPSASPQKKAIAYLLGKPPIVQVGREDWTNKALHGSTAIEQAIDAITRVRNNLFHGGKHTPHWPPGRDEQLVRSSLIVLRACLEQDDDLRNIYEQNVF